MSRTIEQIPHLHAACVAVQRAAEEVMKIAENMHNCKADHEMAKAIQNGLADEAMRLIGLLQDQRKCTREKDAEIASLRAELVREIHDHTEAVKMIREKNAEIQQVRRERDEARAMLSPAANINRFLAERERDSLRAELAAERTLYGDMQRKLADEKRALESAEAELAQWKERAERAEAHRNAAVIAAEDTHAKLMAIPTYREGTATEIGQAHTRIRDLEKELERATERAEKAEVTAGYADSLEVQVKCAHEHWDVLAAQRDAARAQVATLAGQLARARAWGDSPAPHHLAECHMDPQPSECPACALRVEIDTTLAALKEVQS